jgi:hypothetical protein
VARRGPEGQEHGNYRSYLLRLWRAAPRQPWRASLQSTATNEIRTFATVERLVAFLVAGLSDGEDDPPGPPAAQSGASTEEVSRSREDEDGRSHRQADATP